MNEISVAINENGRLYYTEQFVKELSQQSIEKDKEIDRLNNLNNQLVEECQRLDDEETRLNNIINELEEFLNKVVETGASMEQITCKNILNYLQELKENNK